MRCTIFSSMCVSGIVELMEMPPVLRFLKYTLGGVLRAPNQVSKVSLQRMLAGVLHLAAAMPHPQCPMTTCTLNPHPLAHLLSLMPTASKQHVQPTMMYNETSHVGLVTHGLPPVEPDAHRLQLPREDLPVVPGLGGVQNHEQQVGALAHRNDLRDQGGKGLGLGMVVG